MVGGEEKGKMEEGALDDDEMRLMNEEIRNSILVGILIAA